MAEGEAGGKNKFKMQKSKNQKLLWIEMDKEKVFKVAASFIIKATYYFKSAKEILDKSTQSEFKSFYEKVWFGKEKVEFPLSVSFSLNCIEFSLKAISLIYLSKYPRVHGFEREEKIREFEKEAILYQSKIDEDIKFFWDSDSHLRNLDMQWILSIWRYWMRNYKLAKYGDEEKKKLPEDIIGDDLAKEVLEKAYKIKELARHLIRKKSNFNLYL